MIFYEPVLRLDEPLRGTRSFQEQFGGLPWGLPEEKWPFCHVCRFPMSLLAQLSHHPERLNLGKDDRVLYLFVCDPRRGCSLKAKNGGQAVIIVDRSQRKQGLSRPPKHPLFHFFPRLVVTGWTSADDGIPDELRPAFYDRTAMDHLTDEQLREFEILAYDHHALTRLGGIPAYGYPPFCPDTGFRFVGQFGNCMDVSDIVKPHTFSEKRIGSSIRREIVMADGSKIVISACADEPNQWYMKLEPYGFNGMAFLYLNPDPEQPSGFLVEEWMPHPAELEE